MAVLREDNDVRVRKQAKSRDGAARTTTAITETHVAGDVINSYMKVFTVILALAYPILISFPANSLKLGLFAGEFMVLIWIFWP